MRALFTMIALAMAFYGSGIDVALADAGDHLYQKARSQYFTSKNIQSKIAKRSAYRRAASDFQKFVETYPKHEKLPDALFNLGSLHQELAFEHSDRESATKALHYFRRIPQVSPRHSLADDALYYVAEICKRVFHDKACVRDTENRIRTTYANGDMISRLGLSPSVPQTSAPSESQIAEVSSITFEESDSNLRIRLAVNGSRTFKAHRLAADPTLGKNARFFIDIPDSKLSDSLSETNIGSSYVEKVRFGQNTKDRVRVVLDLGKGMDPANVKVRGSSSEILFVIGKVEDPLVAELTPNEAESSPEVKILAQRTSGDIEVEKRKSASAPEPVHDVTTPLEKPDGKTTINVEIPPSPTEVMEVLDSRKFRIIVDAGHGGEDAGAVGPRGTREKDICLSVAKKVADRLKKNDRYEVFMTRHNDVFIELGDRTTFANKKRGDLFVSIHANASPKRSASGISTYFLNNADDEESLRVAMRENGELSPVALPKFNKPEEYYLEVMKASMVKNFHTVQSTDLARWVQNSLVKGMRNKYSKVRDLGVRSARFYVLTGAEMPAILVETSFISNRMEESRLRKSSYQDRLARYIVDGVDKYIESAVAEGKHTALYKP